MLRRHGGVPVKLRLKDCEARNALHDGRHPRHEAVPQAMQVLPLYRDPRRHDLPAVKVEVLTDGSRHL